MELRIQNRTVFGKKTNQLRKNGLIPAEIFGHGFKNEHISVSAKEFSKVFREAGENTIIVLVNEKGEKIPTIVNDVNIDRVKDRVLSVDFHHIRMDEKLQTKVPIEFTGEAPAIKKGLILIKVLYEIEIEALPSEIPHRFEVDTSGLTDAGQDIFVKDLKVGRNVKLITHGDSVIITVAETAKEKEEAPAPTTPTAETGTTTEAADDNPEEAGK
jgi:large subunit ribosomal protein L25